MVELSIGEASTRALRALPGENVMLELDDLYDQASETIGSGEGGISLGDTVNTAKGRLPGRRPT
jgi:hypothetical protein